MADWQLAPPTVLDNGTGVIKAGLAGQDKPTVFLHSTVGRPKHVRVMPGGALEGSSVCVTLLVLCTPISAPEPTQLSDPHLPLLLFLSLSLSLLNSPTKTKLFAQVCGPQGG
jgi:hypothetical protein